MRAEDMKPSGAQPPDGTIRFNANIKKELHMRMKLYSVRSGKPMNDLLEEWIELHTPGLQ